MTNPKKKKTEALETKLYEIGEVDFHFTNANKRVYIEILIFEVNVKKIIYTNIIVLMLIMFSEIFNLIILILMKGGSVYKHYFILVTYRHSVDVFISLFDFTYLLILIGISINIRFLIKYKN